MAREKKVGPKTIEDKKEAMRLILKEGMNQKEAAKKVGVSENTMSLWVQKYGWKKDSLESLLYTETSIFSPGFLEYLNKTDTDTFTKLKAHLGNYWIQNTGDITNETIPN